jgi:hypothetical protein
MYFFFFLILCITLSFFLFCINIYCVYKFVLEDFFFFFFGKFMKGHPRSSCVMIYEKLIDEILCEDHHNSCLQDSLMFTRI